MDILISYLIGAVPTAYLFGKLKGIDLHKCGSGNIGATNAWRVLGKGTGITTLLIDIAKGFAAVKFIALLSGKAGDGLVLQRIYCGIAAILGHTFPVYLKFRGGKGVAATVGVLLGLAPKVLGCAFGVWVAALFISGYVSLSSVLAAIALPIFSIWLDYPNALKVFFLLMGILIIVQHRSNLRRLFAGEEKKFLWKKN